MPDDIDQQDADEFNKFVTVSRLEISQILHALERQAVLVTAGVGGDKFFLTSIVEVNEETDQVLIESGRHNPHKERVLEGQKISCTTSLDKIKIRFQLDWAVLATHAGQEVFAAALPRALMRLQRREYYRMSVPVLAPVKCAISPLQKGAPAASELNLLDISCGGIALMASPEIFSPELGAHYMCTLKLPENEPLKSELEARNSYMIALPGNKPSQRSGFMFVNLPGRSLATIQRYLMQLERLRRERVGST